MGGSAINIFRFSLGDEPREILNWRLWLAVGTFGLMGAARGVDEGLITGTFNSRAFQEEFGLVDLDESALANVKGNVTSMLQMGSILGSLIAFLICDRIGRVRATQQLCVTWIVGIVIFLASSGRIGGVYAGRFIAGVGVGETVVVAPVYLVEIAPASIRGLCTCVFTGAVYLGIMLAFFANWGSELHISEGYNRWAVPTSLHLMFAGLIFILSFFQLETPRFLVSRGKRAEAVANLARIRGLPEDHPYCQNEMAEIEAVYEEQEETARSTGPVRAMKEMFLVRKNVYRLFLLTVAQVLAAFSGGGAITLFAPDLFGILGQTGEKQKLLTSAVLGVVKFVSAMVCALFLVDYIGRRRSLILGISFQTLSLVYIAAFLTAVPVASDPEFSASPSQYRASVAAIVGMYTASIGWALGWNSAQYLLSAELFPPRIRAACASFSMLMHFLVGYGASRAVPNMLLEDGGLTAGGTFWLFAAVCFVSGVWVFFCLPEASGRSLEAIDRLFELPWYKIGLHGKKFAETMDEAQAQERERKQEFTEKEGV